MTLKKQNGKSAFYFEIDFLYFIIDDHSIYVKKSQQQQSIFYNT